MKNLKTFKLFLEESVTNVVFTFGRFNPPTTGHLKLLDKVASVAKKESAHYKIFSSQSEDPKKNPLSYESKIKWMRKLYPKHARSIVLNKSIKNAIDALVSLYSDGYKNVTMVVGSDRIPEFKSLLNKYNGVKARHGYYMFQNGINIISAGERDPDSDDVSGMSASKLRAAVSDGDIDLFKTGISNPKYADDLYRDLRSAMGIKESTRELYVRGEIFNEGTKVKYNGETATIVSRGPNYLKLKLTNETTKKVWLTEVEQL